MKIDIDDYEFYSITSNKISFIDKLYETTTILFLRIKSLTIELHKTICGSNSSNLRMYFSALPIFFYIAGKGG